MPALKSYTAIYKEVPEGKILVAGSPLDASEEDGWLVEKLFSHELAGQSTTYIFLSLSASKKLPTLS